MKQILKRHKDHITDYHDFLSISTSKYEREKLGIGDIWINAIVCLSCGDYVRSRNRHDFRYCTCGSIAVDGGSFYQRIVGDLSNYQSILIPFNYV